MRFSSNNTLFNLPYSQKVSLFSLTYPTQVHHTIQKIFPKPTHTFLYKTSPMTTISNLQITPLCLTQYARSSGVFSKLFSKNMSNHTALVQLPSGVKKIFSLYSLAQLGEVFSVQKINCNQKKSGY